MKKLDKKSLIILISVLVGLGIVYYLTANVIPRVIVSFTKAAPATKISVGRSTMLGERILAKADGLDKCIVNIFLMDESGKGVAGKTAELSSLDEGVEIRQMNASSDDMGKVKFELSSGQEGQYRLAGSVGGVPVGKMITVTFRN